MDTSDVITHVFEEMKKQLIKAKKSDISFIVDENMDKLMECMAKKNASIYSDLLKQMETIPMVDK